MIIQEMCDSLESVEERARVFACLRSKSQARLEELQRFLEVFHVAVRVPEVVHHPRRLLPLAPPPRGARPRGHCHLERLVVPARDGGKLVTIEKRRAVAPTVWCLARPGVLLRFAHRWHDAWLVHAPHLLLDCPVVVAHEIVRERDARHDVDAHVWLRALERCEDLQARAEQR